MADLSLQRSILPHLLLRPLLHLRQGRNPGRRLARRPPAKRAGRRNASSAGGLGGVLERLEQRRGRLVRQVLVIVVVDLQHRRVGARAQALHFCEREQPVCRRLAVVHAQDVGARFHHRVRVAKHAWGLRGALALLHAAGDGKERERY